MRTPVSPAVLGANSRHLVCSVAFLLMIAFTAPSAENDTAAFRHHKIQIDPVSLLVGGFYGYYEFRFDQHHAAAVNGGYSLPLTVNKAWSAGGNYRFYYNEKAFVGIFVINGYQSMKLPSTERGDTTKYSLDISYLTSGANWGKTWYFRKRFPLTFRAGLGYPLKSDLSWKNGVRHPMADTYEPLYRFITWIDSELSIGLAF